MMRKHTGLSLKLIVLFLGLVVFTACRKHSTETTVVEVVVASHLDGSPYAGVPVRLVEESYTQVGNTPLSVQTGETDANGRARFEFKAKRKGHFRYMPYIDESYFGPSKSDWVYFKHPGSSLGTVIKDTYNEIRYEIIYYSYLKKVIKNVNCQGEDDKLRIHFWSGFTHESGSKAYDNSQEKTGCYESDTTYINNNYPPGTIRVYEGMYYYEWEVERNGEITNGIDSVYLERNEIGRAELFY